MVPTILIDTSNAIITLYCTKHDLLFISDTFSWRDGDKFNLGGITFPWAMINHRYEIVMGIFTILTQCTLLIPDRYFLQMIEGTIEPSRGVAKPGHTRAFAQASTYFALPSPNQTKT